MENTEQFNIRLPELLIYDLEFISQHLKVNRNDWLRAKISRLILEEKAVIIEKFKVDYSKGFLDDNEFQKFTGIAPTEGMKELRKHKMMIRKDYTVNFKEYAERILEELKKEGKNKVPMDKYLKKIAKRIDKQKKKIKFTPQ